MSFWKMTASFQVRSALWLVALSHAPRAFFRFSTTPRQALYVSMTDLRDHRSMAFLIFCLFCLASGMYSLQLVKQSTICLLSMFRMQSLTFSFWSSTVWVQSVHELKEA